MDEKKKSIFENALNLIARRSPKASAEALELLNHLNSLDKSEIEQRCSRVLEIAVKDPKAKYSGDEMKALIELENILGTKTEVIKFRVSPKEKNELEENAREELGKNGINNEGNRVNLSDYIRKKVLGK